MGMYDVAKDALKVAQKIDNVELVQKLLDIQKMALDMQESIQKKNEENSNLKNEIENLRSTINTKESYNLERGVYWLGSDKNKEQPFCPSCYAKGTIMPMQKSWAGYGSTASPYRCSDTECQATADPWDVSS